MKKILCILLLIISGNFYSQNAQKIFDENLNIIERFRNGETIPGTGLDDAVKFLEEITSIKSFVDQQFDGIIIPTEKNLKSWKKWYEKNKELLYWDENSKKVKVRNLKVPE
jgi:hypothetical protein